MLRSILGSFGMFKESAQMKSVLSLGAFALIVLACIAFAVGTGIWRVLLVMGIVVFLLESPWKKQAKDN